MSLHLKRIGRLLAALVALAALACAGSEKATDAGTSGVITGPPAAVPATTSPEGRAITPSDFRVAFLGDQGAGTDARAVLDLVRSEGADLLLLLGDFDYDDNPEAWNAMIEASLGRDFPVFGVIGNHDEDRWPEYRRHLTERLTRVPGARCEGDYGVNAACSYQGLFFLLSGAGTKGRGHAGFIRDALDTDESTWSICAWHKNQAAMQVGGKDDDTGWDVYEACRQGGAIIATAHEHSYQRTRTLSNVREQTIDPVYREPGRLRVGGGSTFVFVSGLGGRSVRNQERCRPSTPPYGCNGTWASIYTEDQGATYGALFIDFNVDGDPRKARGYFKNVSSQVIDRFEVIAESGESTSE